MPGLAIAQISDSRDWPTILTPAFQGKEFWVQHGCDGDGSWKAPIGNLRDVIGTVTTRVGASASDIVTKLRAGVQNVIHVLPRDHDSDYAWQGIDETGGGAGGIVVPRFAAGLMIIGQGPRGAMGIDPSTEDAVGLDIRADDVEIRNLGVAAEDDTAANVALKVFGARVRLYGCKIEGGDIQLQVGPGTVAQEAAGTHGTAGDFLAKDCEFCWGAKGVVITASDYGALTQARFLGCKFHNLSAAAFEEAGGSADIRFRNLEIGDCVFDDLEGGTAPTAFILLNDNNANDGIVHGCRFPSAINSGKNLVSTALHWVCNMHTGGISTGQPS